MRNSFRDGSFKILVSVIVPLSIFGGYLLWHLIFGMNAYCQQRTERLLAMQNSVDDATIAFSKQIQEWKDMLLRAQDPALYSKHKNAFFEYGDQVQQALLRTKVAMQNEHMDTSMIEQTLIEHKTLSSDYLLAKSLLNPLEIASFREVDKQVIGIDRSLQKQLAAIRSDIIRHSRQQSEEASSAQWNGYLAGFFGACSLMIMALAGFAIAKRFAGNES